MAFNFAFLILSSQTYLRTNTKNLKKERENGRLFAVNRQADSDTSPVKIIGKTPLRRLRIRINENSTAQKNSLGTRLLGHPVGCTRNILKGALEWPL